MKSPKILFFLLFLFLGSEAHSQTLNWGSPAFSELRDSKGNVLDDTFVFELGSFTGGFTPEMSNVMDWMDNWQTFDVADYNGIETPVDDGISGYFTSTVSMTSAGLSNSPDLSSGAISFEGLDAYVWIRNSAVPSLSTEWLVVRDPSWIFPTADEECCGKGIPMEWSVSDLAVSDIPLWGKQGGTVGDGIITNTGTPHTLQTATFDEPMLVPEPSVFLLNVLAVTLLVFRRSRAS